MSDFIIGIFKEFPWSLYVALIFFIIILVLLIWLIISSYKKGLSLDILGIKVGQKEEGKNGSKETNQIPYVTQSQTITINTGQSQKPTELTPEQIQRIEEKIGQIHKEETGNLISKYKSPSLDQKTSYVLSIVFDTRKRLAKIVLNSGGGWAGCSIAPIEVYLDYGRNIIGNELAQEISDLLALIGMYTFHEDTIPDKDLLRIQYLNADINMNLEVTYDKLQESGKLPFLS